jgi:threonine/homoserine/homoserine lactone efflux protein
MAGIIILAGLVNLVELLCTAGFPALYTQILTLQQMPAWEYYGYLGLYNLAYIFDDSLMVTIAVVTLGRRKLQERAGRWLKLTSGLVMVGLSAVLLLEPKWLM